MLQGGLLLDLHVVVTCLIVELSWIHVHMPFLLFFFQGQGDGGFRDRDGRDVDKR